MKRAILVVALSTLLATGLGQPAKALVTDWAVVKYYPTLYYGDVISSSITDNGAHPINSYWWGYKASNETTYTPFSSLATFTSVEDAIGVQDIRLVVTYSSTSGSPAPPPTTIDHSITVLPPEEIFLTAGLNLSTNLGSSRCCTFILRGDGRDLNLYAAIVSAQEMLSSTSWNDPPGYPPSSGPDDTWLPVDELPEEFAWEWSCQTILDFKGEGGGPIWNYAGNDDWLWRYTQKNRVRLQNIDGTTPWYELPNSYALEHHKIDSSTWKVIVQ